MNKLNSYIINKKIFLLVLPVVYMFFFLLYRESTIYKYILCVDPEFAYFFNGLNIAQFTLKVHHVDHPGTVLQIFCAIVFRVTHLFSGDGDLHLDVM